MGSKGNNGETIESPFSAGDEGKTGQPNAEVSVHYRVKEECEENRKWVGGRSERIATLKRSRAGSAVGFRDRRGVGRWVAIVAPGH